MIFPITCLAARSLPGDTRSDPGALRPPGAAPDTPGTGLRPKSRGHPGLPELGRSPRGAGAAAAGADGASPPFNPRSLPALPSGGGRGTGHGGEAAPGWSPRQDPRSRRPLRASARTYARSRSRTRRRRGRAPRRR